MMSATTGDNVKVHYTGRLEDGTVFDSSEGREPLEFKLGEGQVIPGFESAVRGMSQGETKTTQIPADHAYGPHHAEMVLVVPRSQFPPNFNPKPGDQLEIKQDDGQSFYVHVTEIGETDIGLDANHPLAGKDLIFDIQLVQVNGD